MRSINNGQIVGSVRNSDGEQRPALWNPDGSVTDLGSLGGNDGVATAVNASGEVVGYSALADGTQHGFIWTPAGHMVDLGTLGGGGSNVVGIDSAGEVAGSSPTADGFSHAFLWTPTAGMQDLGTLPGGSESNAVALSSSGEVVGTADDGAGVVPFAYTAATGMHALGILPNSTGTFPEDVNSTGQIAGYSYLPITRTFFGLEATAWGVGQQPTITSAASTSVNVRSTFDFKVTTTGFPTSSVAEAGSLPAGVGFTDNGDGTADLSGAASAGTAGNYPLTITATNGAGDPVTQSFQLTVTTTPLRPAFTSAASDTETFGVPFSFRVSTDGNPAPKISKSGALPAGVTITDNGDGSATIAGTPTNGAIGTYPVTLTAKNAAGTSAQAFTLAVTKAPKLVKIPNATVSVGSPVNVPITAKGYTTPALVEYGQLPAGITLTDNGNGTGVLGGAPEVGSGEKLWHHSDGEHRSGDGRPIGDNQGCRGTGDHQCPRHVRDHRGRLLLPADGDRIPDPEDHQDRRSTKGVTYSAATQTLSGTAKPGTAGRYPITFTATNSAATTAQSFTLTVS